MTKREKSFKFLGEGRNRITFLTPSGKYVVKVPLNEAGVYDNWKESKSCKSDFNLMREHKARCRMLGFMLVMEFVEEKISRDDLPEWTCWVDCGQVGLTWKGKLVAFDYA